MDTSVALREVMVSRVNTYPHIHQVVCIKYVQLFRANHTSMNWFKETSCYITHMSGKGVKGKQRG